MKKLFLAGFVLLVLVSIVWAWPVYQGTLYIIGDSTTALTVEKADGTDVFVVNTTDSTTTITGALDLTGVSTNQIRLPLNNDASNPTICFDGGSAGVTCNSGFYESSNNVIIVTTNGVAKFAYSGNEFRAMDGNGPTIINNTSSATTPVFIPDRSDTDTGIGHAGADLLSAIAGGVEVMRFATSTTSVLKDMVFVGAGSGLQYASIYADDNATTTVLAQQDTWYQVTIFSADGPENGADADHTSDDITTSKTGDYMVNVSLDIQSSASNAYYLSVFKNNGATEIHQLEGKRQTTVAGKPGSVTLSGIASFNATDTVEVWVKRTDGGGTSKNITIEHINLSLFQIGG